VANASPLVQGVMLILLLASLTSWVMIFQRWFFLRRIQREIEDFEDHFWSGIDLRQLYGELAQEEGLTGIEAAFVAGFKEYTRLTEEGSGDPDAIMQGVQRAMRIALTREEERLDTHLPFLATVGSTSPYVGLFGTVWGIMNSFRSLANMTPILEAAATLAALGAIDSLLTSVIADNVTKTKHKSNQELIGQGVGNAIGGLFGGLPGAGATMRTLVNIRSGGRNKTSGIIHSLVLLVVLLGAGKYAALIPQSVLAGILITVGIGILDYKSLKHINKVPKADAVIMVSVLGVTVFFDLLIAVGIGMVMASILFMKKMSDLVDEKTMISDFNSVTDEISWPDEKMPKYMQDNVVIKHLDGPLFFGFASGFQDKLSKLPDIKYVIIRMEKVPFIDQSGLYALEEAILALERRGIHVLLTGLQTQPEDMMRRIRIIPGLVSEDNLFKNFKGSIDWLISTKKSELL
jgi:MFS superfamily sulfate permease-like transporter